MSQTDNSAAIGVFDSGIGGLSTLREIRSLLPHEHLIYVADSAYVPYGDKSREFVAQRSIAVSEFLLSQGAKAIVVACNTATSAAIETLRTRFQLPVIGVEPALKPAAQKSRSGIIGVLATSGTLTGDKFTSLHQRFATEVQVLTQPCAGLVEQVEAGDPSGPTTRALVERYVLPLLERGADTLVLGCTHYPFLASLIQEVAGPDVSVIDPSPAVARELQRRLEEETLLSTETSEGSERFWTSGFAQNMKKPLSRLWGVDREVRQLPTAWAVAGVGSRRAF